MEPEIYKGLDPYQIKAIENIKKGKPVMYKMHIHHDSDTPLIEMTENTDAFIYGCYFDRTPLTGRALILNQGEFYSGSQLEGGKELDR